MKKWKYRRLLVPDFEMYSDETCEEAIKNFQQKLKDADNFKGGTNPDYKEFWQVMRKEGPMILNVTKHLYQEHIRNKENA